MAINMNLVVEEGDAEVKLVAEKVSIADLQSALANLELIKLNLLGQLASMTEIDKKIQVIGDKNDEDKEVLEGDN